MTTGIRGIRLFASTACAAALLTGCASTTAGTPVPSPSASTANTNVFANLDACTVLDQVLAGQGFPPGERKTRRNECGSTKSGYEDQSLALDPVQGLAEFTETDPSFVPIDVNGRKAMQAESEVKGQCSVAIEVSLHARAVVIATLTNSQDSAAACADAKRFAEQVEPLLPKVH